MPRIEYVVPGPFRKRTPLPVISPFQPEETSESSSSAASTEIERAGALIGVFVLPLMITTLPFPDGETEGAGVSGAEPGFAEGVGLGEGDGEGGVTTGTTEGAGVESALPPTTITVPPPLPEGEGL